jgi:hypothetical protein
MLYINCARLDIDNWGKFCPLHKALRHRIWTEETPVARKLHGSLEDLQQDVGIRMH